MEASPELYFPVPECIIVAAIPRRLARSLTFGSTNVNESHYGRMGQVGGPETTLQLSASQDSKSEELLPHLGETAEISDTIKNLEVVELVLPLQTHSAHPSGTAQAKLITGNGRGRA